MNVPSELIVGDTWEWTESLSDYPATTYTLTFYFVNSDNTFTVVAAADGSDYAITVAVATTATRVAGRYRWTARVAAAGEVFTVGQGFTEVKADPTAQQDVRSHARITLDALEAVIQGRATSDQLSVSINNRSITRLTPAELEQWRDRLREEVRVEEEGSQNGIGRDIRVRLLRGY